MTRDEKVAIVKRAAEGGAFRAARAGYYANQAGTRGESEEIAKTVLQVEELLGEHVEPYDAPWLLEAALWPHHRDPELRTPGWIEFRDRVWGILARRMLWAAS